jgi:hypothetical protein
MGQAMSIRLLAVVRREMPLKLREADSPCENLESQPWTQLTCGF